MTAPRLLQVDPELDIVLEREVGVPREVVWAAWTRPEHVSRWFAPVPWSIPQCEIDLRPGGAFRCVMRSPEGKEYPNVGCYLEIVPAERLVWTDALLPGFRPSEDPLFTAILALEPRGTGTRYSVTALHRDASVRQRHEEVGFRDAWGTALDQLAVHLRSM
jgi:uncharacterized protein YndB with AHSA1/START domain